MLNFYWRFLTAIAKILHPLTSSLRGSKKGEPKLEWSDTMRQAFEASKQALICHIPGASSAWGCSQPGGWRLVDACWRQAALTLAGVHNLGTPEQAQTRYSAFDRVFLACVTSIRHFCHMLEGQQFAFLMDHKPLTFALGWISEPWRARQPRHLSYIAEYTSDIWYISGVSNVVADTMSRPPPCPQQSTSSASKPAGPASVVADIKVPSGLSVAALSAVIGSSSSTAPASV